MKSRIFLIILSILVLLAGAAAGVYLVQRKQNLQQQAAVPGGSADMGLNPANINSLTVGHDFDVDINFTSPTVPITLIQAQITYTYEGDAPAIEARNISENPDLTSSGWRYTNSNPRCNSGTCTIEAKAVFTETEASTYVNTTKFATISFRVNAAGTANLTFNTTNTIITSKLTGEDILLQSSLTGPWSYSTGTTVADSPTPTATETQGTLPTNSPTATPTGDDGGPSNNVCNLTCNSSSDCGGGLTCYQGQCRNNSCKSDGDCNCNNNPTPSPTVRAGSPTSTPIPLPTDSSGAVLPQSGSATNTFILIGFGLLVMLGGAIIATKQ